MKGTAGKSYAKFHQGDTVRFDVDLDLGNVSIKVNAALQGDGPIFTGIKGPIFPGIICYSWRAFWF